MFKNDNFCIPNNDPSLPFQMIHDQAQVSLSQLKDKLSRYNDKMSESEIISFETRMICIFKC